MDTTTLCPATGQPTTWRCHVTSVAGSLLLIVFELTYWWKSDVGTRWVDRQLARLVAWKIAAAGCNDRAHTTSRSTR